MLARCYVATDPDCRPGLLAEAAAAVDRLNAVPGRPGYVTETFCVERRATSGPRTAPASTPCATPSRTRYAGTPLWPVLLTSLLEAADRVDSTTGLQMAYLKQWAPRADRPLTLRVPDLLAGPGPGRPGRRLRAGRHRRPRPTSTWPTSTRPTTSTATTPTTTCGRRWWPGTRPSTTGWPASGPSCATRRPAARSTAAGPCRRPWPRWWPGVDAEVVVLSYNNESWLTYDELHDLCSARGHVEVLAFDSARYVGARIGIHDPPGRKVGSGLPPPQHRVRGAGRPAGPGPGHGRGRPRRPDWGPGRPPGARARRLTGAGLTGLTAAAARWERGAVRPRTDRTRSAADGCRRHRADAAGRPPPTRRPAAADTREAEDMGALDGRIAIITGAGRGIGREYALLFAAEGAKVVVNDLGGTLDGSGDDVSAAQQVVDEITAAGGEAVANHDDVDRLGGRQAPDRHGRRRPTATCTCWSTTPASCATGCSST